MKIYVFTPGAVNPVRRPVKLGVGAYGVLVNLTHVYLNLLDLYMVSIYTGALVNLTHVYLNLLDLWLVYILEFLST